MNNDNIYVTKPALPELEEILPYLRKIWDTRILSNCGEFHQLLEKELANFLNVEHVSLVSNATMGIYIALEALNIKGEVITSPFSFIATTNPIVSKILSRYLLILIKIL